MNSSMGRLSGVATTGKGRLGTDQRGIILVVTLMVVLILALLGTAFLTISGTEHQIAKNDQEITQALHVAEGGLQTAINQLNQGLLLAPATVTGVLTPGEYTATVASAPPPAGQQRIEAVGYVPTQASPRAVKKIGVLGTSGVLFGPQALFGRDGVTISKTGGTDSYDSANGLYGGANVSSNGNVGSNGNITLTGTPVVNGDATAGGTVINNVQHGAPTPVTGTVTNNAMPVFPQDVACPSGGYTPSASVPSGPGISYNSTTGVLNISQNTNLTLSPGTYYFSSINVDQNGILTFTSGGDTNLYISGQLTFNQNSTISNQSHLPTALTVWGCGANSSSWQLNLGSETYLALYGPDHPLAISGGADMYGAVVAASIDDSGGSKIHYDKALGRKPTLHGKVGIVPGSWTELAL